MRRTTSIKITIEVFSIRRNPNFWSFWQTRSLAKYKVHRLRDIFARIHANRLSFGRQQHHQVSNEETLDLLLSAPYITRNLSGDEHALFVVDEDIFIVCTRHACGLVHSLFFCFPGFGLHAHLLGHTAMHQNDQAKRRPVRHVSMGACGAFFSLSVLVSKCMRTSRR